MGLGWLLPGVCTSAFVQLCVKPMKASLSAAGSVYSRTGENSPWMELAGFVEVATSCFFLPQLLLGNLMVVTDLKSGFMNQQVSLVLNLYSCL